MAVPEKSRRPNLVLLVVGLGTLLSAMSGSSVNLALPEIALELGIDITRTGWIVTSYLLASVVLLLLAGRVGDLVGHRRVYLAGFSLFGVASLVCGLAGTFEWLVAGRVAQGVGASLVMASGPALLTTSFPGSQRGTALGRLATATYTGLTIGPLLAGLVLAKLSWGWIFFVNLPVAVVVVGLGLVYLPHPERRPEVRFDWPGTVSMFFGLPLVLFAVVEGGHFGWASSPILGSALVGGGLLAAFVAIEVRARAPLLDLELFRSRVFSGATLSALANYVAIFVPIIMVPFYLKEGLGVPSVRVGFILSAQPLVMALVASPSGQLSDRIGSRWLATGGLLVLAAGVGGLTTLTAETSQSTVVVWLALMGLGTGIFISPNSSALMGAAPRGQQGVAGGVMAMARSLGMITGVTAATTVFAAAGGETGRTWVAADFEALRVAFWVATVVCLAGAAAASMRGRELRNVEHAPATD